MKISFARWRSRPDRSGYVQTYISMKLGNSNVNWYDYDSNPDSDRYLILDVLA